MSNTQIRAQSLGSEQIPTPLSFDSRTGACFAVAGALTAPRCEMRRTVSTALIASLSGNLIFDTLFEDYLLCGLLSTGYVKAPEAGLFDVSGMLTISFTGSQPSTAFIKVWVYVDDVQYGLAGAHDIGTTTGSTFAHFNKAVRVKKDQKISIRLEYSMTGSPQLVGGLGTWMEVRYAGG